MRVATLLVVGGHHVRPERPDHPHQCLDLRLGVQVAERAGRQLPVGRIALVVAGVLEAQPLVGDAENLGGIGHLLLPQHRHVVRIELLVRGVEHIAALAAGAGHDDHPDAVGGVPRRRRRALAGLVVRMGMDGHQAQRSLGGCGVAIGHGGGSVLPVDGMRAPTGGGIAQVRRHHCPLARRGAGRPRAVGRRLRCRRAPPRPAITASRARSHAGSWGPSCYPGRQRTGASGISARGRPCCFCPAAVARCRNARPHRAVPGGR